MNVTRKGVEFVGVLPRFYVVTLLRSVQRGYVNHVKLWLRFTC